ncbi:hypothetical protein AVEN_264724-1 [Araneus ventricosus]|uniref:Uncharacterized protein n=1 Tax=Araneus ventricosus TaxID=182803 RepID=A0A4Y2RBK1_ARAVE|nr:hypothetical protein AVEN_264724-1 [Araneus ventricosus]
MEIDATIEHTERNGTRTIVIIIFSDKNNSNQLTLARHVMELAEHVTKDTADSDASIFLQNLDDPLSLFEHFNLLLDCEYFRRTLFRVSEDDLRKDLQLRRQHAL